MPKLIDRVRVIEGQPFPEKFAQESLGDGWLVEFRLDWTGTDWIVGELRVFYEPTAKDLMRAPEPPLPPGGLTARRLRNIRFEAVRTLAREALDASIAESHDPDELRRLLEERRLARRAKARTEGRTRWADADYIALAARYVDKVRDGTRAPVAELATETSYSPARIRQALKHARDRGWLTETTRRRPGGALTDEALAIARREREEQS